MTSAGAHGVIGRPADRVSTFGVSRARADATAILYLNPNERTPNMTDQPDDDTSPRVLRATWTDANGDTWEQPVPESLKAEHRRVTREAFGPVSVRYSATDARRLGTFAGR